MISLMTLVGCASKPDDPFFRAWTSADGTSAVDLRGGQFSTTHLSGGPNFGYTFHASIYDITNSISCSCRFWADGGYQHGDYAISGCAASSAPPDGSICGYGQAGTYTASTGALTLCRDGLPTQCLTYR